jgi:hypothetical protein
MAICASTSSSQYSSPNLSECWPSNVSHLTCFADDDMLKAPQNLQSPSSDTGVSDYQWTGTPNRPFMDFPNGNVPVFQYEAGIPWTGAQMQHEWPAVPNEYNKKRRSTVSISTKPLEKYGLLTVNRSGKSRTETLNVLSANAKKSMPKILSDESQH